MLEQSNNADSVHLCAREFDNKPPAPAKVRKQPKKTKRKAVFAKVCHRKQHRKR